MTSSQPIRSLTGPQHTPCPAQCSTHASVYKSPNGTDHGEFSISEKTQMRFSGLHLILLYNFTNFVRVCVVDGNGRTGRQLMTLILLREGFSPPGILREERDLHYYLSDLARHGHPRHFAHFILNSIQRMSQHARPSMLF